MPHLFDDTGSGYKHILKYTGVFGGVQLLNILIGIVRNKIVAQMLGPQGFGLVALFNSATRFISDATSFGIGTSAVKELSVSRDGGDAEQMRQSVETLRRMELAAAVLGMAVCVLLGGAFSSVTFSWGDHSLHFVLLSPVVGCMAITAGEVALLKAARKLKILARQSLETTLIALVVTIPILYYMGERGVVPMLVAVAAAQMATVVRFSCRLYPYRVRLAFRPDDAAMRMLRVGMAFVAASVIGSLTELAMRAYLNNVADLPTLGLYNAGYMMIVTYAGMVFSAMETDYYPRLSGVKSLGSGLNAVVCRQMEVSFLIISPMVVGMLVAMPVLLPVLFSPKFMPVLPMLQVAALSMYFSSLYIPVEYISLARGDWRSFLLLEALSRCLMLLLMLLCFNAWGLLGCGICITSAYFLESVMVCLYARRRFCFRLSRRIWGFVAAQLPAGVAALWVSVSLDGLPYWLIGIALTATSAAISLRLFRRFA